MPAMRAPTGVLCEVGINLRGDLPGLTDGVRPFCQRGADRGDPSAKRGLGYLLVNGFMGPRNPTEARKLFEASAADGDARGQYQLALLDLYGAGQDPNYAEARELFEQSAQHGIAAAERQIGVMYECGLGVPADEKQAALHYDMAYGGGDNVAAYLTEGANMAPGRTNEFGPEAQDTLDLSQLGRLRSGQPADSLPLLHRLQPAARRSPGADAARGGRGQGQRG